MTDLIKMLEEAANDSGAIRLDLEKISRDLNAMKAGIEAMVATANVQYEAKVAQLQREIDHEQARVNDKTGCFKDVGSGFATIFSFGISCAI
jgi:hypothetical protein